MPAILLTPEQSARRADLHDPDMLPWYMVRDLRRHRRSLRLTRWLRWRPARRRPVRALSVAAGSGFHTATAAR